MKALNWKEMLIGIVVILGSVWLLLYKIDAQYMWTDEVYSFEAAQMVIKTGETTFPTGMAYPRATFYHHLLASSMKVFGENEFGSRIINIPFILGTMILIYFILRKKNKLLGLSGSLLYLTTNFTIALVRETRMYSVATFFLILTVFALYEGFINVKNGSKIKIGKLEYEVNIPWLMLTFISFYLMYDTQPLTLLFGFGVILFYFFKFILEQKKEDLLLVLSLTVLAILGIYFKYGTLNLIDLYFKLSPDWANKYPPPIPYYSFILTINLPWCFLFAPISLFILSKYTKKLELYLFSIFFSMLLILSLLQAQAERYIVSFIPLLIILTLFSLYEFYIYLKKIKPKLSKFFIPLVILIILIPQSIYLTKEMNEIDTYTKYSVAIYKKYEFNDLEKYLSENLKDTDYLIADFHSVYTLYAMDFDIDYFLLPEEDQHWEWGERDTYFGIPLMNYERDLVNFTEQTKKEGGKIFVVLRDERLFDNIEEILGKDSTFTNIPSLFIIQ